MYIDFFYLLFLLAIGSFIATLLFPDKGYRLLFSILSVAMWLVTAFASLYVEKVSVHVIGTEIVQETTIIYSSTFPYVCGAFMAFSLIHGIITGLSFLEDIKTIKQGKVNV